MKYKFDLEVTSIDECIIIENWCKKNAPGDWKVHMIGFAILVELTKAEDATAFRLRFGV